MTRTLLNIALVIAAVCVTGCAEMEPKAPQVSRNPLGGIKLDDLKHDSRASAPKQTQFQLLTFDVPADNKDLLEGVFGLLEQGSVHFTNRKAFWDNGFAAGYGRDEMWNDVAVKLRQTRARKTRTDRLVIYDDQGDDIIVSTIDNEHTVFYTTSDGVIAGVTLTNGSLAWRIRALPIAQFKDVAQVGIEPVFVPNSNSTIGRLAGKTTSEEVVFDSAAFNLKMSEGDFLFLGPRQYDEEDLSLSDLFFFLRSDFYLPRPIEDNQDSIPAKKPAYSLHKDVPLVRLYLLVCVRVQG